MHEKALAMLTDVRWLPAHVLAESFSSLTRLPQPHRAWPAEVWQALRRNFPEEPVVLSVAGYLETFGLLAAAGMAGGRVYDAIIGATAAQAGARLLSADRRAVATYALVGAEFELVL
jgi:toxin FitB